MGGKLRRLQGDEGARRHKSRSLSSTYSPGMPASCPHVQLCVCAEREGGRKRERRREKTHTDLTQTCMYEASCRRTLTRVAASGCHALPDAQSLNIQGDIRAPRAAIADVTPLTCAHVL